MQEITPFLWFDGNAEEAAILGDLLNDEDDAKSKRVMEARLQMDKLDFL